MNYEVQKFEEQVILRSHNNSVLVDFWAPWCQPCRMISPVLKKLASEANGKWELIMVNVDEHLHLAYQYGIKGIPNVKLFYQGEVINEFRGAMSENMIKQWLDENIPLEEKR